jgi:single-strand DNA-binding protein
MANGYNRVIVVGNLGADPELRMTQGGQAVLKLRLATSETYLDRNKVRQERTEWHSVIVWGRRAEALARLLSKGSKIFVEGSVRTTSWEDQETGQKKYRTEVNANEIILAGSAAERERFDRSFPNDDPNDGLPPQDYTGGDDIPF